MTDEQIIQAVDLCANAQEDCRKCPLHSVYSANCIKRLMNITLDLIKRQQARIEQEVDLNREMFEKMARDEAEIERKGKILNSYALQYGTVTDQSKKIKEIKDEAYKEFAERLNKNFETYMDDEEKNALYMRNLINNLVKELTEEK